MLPRGSLVCLSVASGIVAAIAAVTAWFSQSFLPAQISMGAIVVCACAGLAIPLAPSRAGGASTQLARLVTSLLALWACNGVAAVAFSGTRSGEALGIFAWSMVLIGVQGLVLASPSLNRRRRVDTARTLAQGIAIWSAVTIVVAAQVCGLVLAVIPPRGAPWMGSGQLWLNMACSFAFLGALLASLSTLAPRTGADAFGSGAGLVPAMVRARRGIMLILTVLATGFLVIPTFWSVIDGMDAMGSRDFEVWVAYACLLAALPVGFAAWNLVGTVPMSRLSGILRAVSSFFAVVCLACYATALMPRADILFDSGSFWAFGAVSMVIALVLGFAAFAIGWLRADTASRSHAIESITWRCPRCSAWFAIDPGANTRCGGCGLAVQVMLRDDQCPQCRYDLHALGDGPATCPECGRERQVTVALPGTKLAATPPGTQQDSKVGSVHAVVAGEVRA